MDAGLFGNRLSPRQAYRFACGEEVVSSTGQAVRLSRPLDWLVIADHSDGMGLVGDIAAGKPDLMAYEQGARWNKGIEEGGAAGVAAALDLIGNFSQGTIDPKMMALYSPGSKLYKNLWEKVIDDAEEFNDPGTFTAFIGFEWTSLIQGNKLHHFPWADYRHHAAAYYDALYAFNSEEREASKSADELTPETEEEAKQRMLFDRATMQSKQAQHHGLRATCRVEIIRPVLELVRPLAE